MLFPSLDCLIFSLGPRTPLSAALWASDKGIPFLLLDILRRLSIVCFLPFQDILSLLVCDTSAHKGGRFGVKQMLYPELTLSCRRINFVSNLGNSLGLQQRMG